MTDEQDGRSGADAAFTRVELINIELWRFEKAGPGVEVYFSGRHGGVSRPPCDSLNLGFNVGDEAGQVHKNRQLLGRALGHKASTITSPRQQHTGVVCLLDNELDIGAGAKWRADSPFDPCDALITGIRQAPLQLQYADCLPLVLIGRGDGAPVIAVVHAGRRGLAAGVIGNTVDTMVARGADPAAMTAAIGPCIHSCCYQVDGETAAGFAGRFGDAVLPGDRLDLPAAAGDELVAAGLTAERVHVLDICTCCDGRFFSHRRDGDGTGRQGAIAWIV
ncbi:laccase domain protein YfiH [bacterium BMS3Abin01]|nr:laccase domain protein YfiH [bacterium BMS3Abin01]HDY69993.1 laccase domain-containing protein [Actinomycetota bacterium]